MEQHYLNQQNDPAFHSVSSRQGASFEASGQGRTGKASAQWDGKLLNTAWKQFEQTGAVEDYLTYLMVKRDQFPKE
jgi:hypothetical protein